MSEHPKIKSTRNTLFILSYERTDNEIDYYIIKNIKIFNELVGYCK